jgi:hypothetical protein
MILIHNTDLAFNIILMRFQAAALLAALAFVPACAKHLTLSPLLALLLLLLLAAATWEAAAETVTWGR